MIRQIVTWTAWSLTVAEGGTMVSSPSSFLFTFSLAWKRPNINTLSAFTISNFTSSNKCYQFNLTLTWFLFCIRALCSCSFRRSCSVFIFSQHLWKSTSIWALIISKFFSLSKLALSCSSYLTRPKQASITTLTQKLGEKNKDVGGWNATGNISLPFSPSYITKLN